MKKIAFGFLSSFVGFIGSGYALDIKAAYPTETQSFADPLQKHGSSSSSSSSSSTSSSSSDQKRLRGDTGPRGHTGHRGHRGRKGDPGFGASSVADRAYLLAPNSENPGPILIDPVLLPMVVPVDRTDLSSSFFESMTHSFKVPESGVYQVNYFLKAIQGPSRFFRGEADASGLVIGIAIDGNLLNPIGIRSLPLMSSQVPDVSFAAGMHQIFVRLNQGQTVQLAVLAAPFIPGDVPCAIEMLFMQTDSYVDETASLSIQKVGT